MSRTKQSNFGVRQGLLIAVFFATFYLTIWLMHFGGIQFSFYTEKPENQGETRQMVFAKIHKAASSTVQNILLRFALVRELDVLLPKEGTHVNEFTPTINQDSLIWQPTGKPFDVLSNHLIFNAVEISKYIPSSAFRFGILREPLSQTLSALQFYATFYLYPWTTLNKAMKTYPDDPIQGFLNHPEDFCDELWKANQCFFDNRMSMDLGFDSSDMYESKRNETLIQHFVAQIDREFDLMLIVEYFDESMILLRRNMHWHIKDVLYMKVNASPYKSKFMWNRNTTLTPEQTEIFGQWAAVDIALYDHFLAKFLEKIAAEQFFIEEVRTFKQIRSNVSQFCEHRQEGESLKIPQNRWTEEFFVSQKECEKMMLSEVELVQVVRTQQLDRHKKTLWCKWAATLG